MPNADVESLAQGVVERLSEDEALRGNLTDEGFGPLLQWAVDAALAYANNLQSSKPEEEMDAFGSRLKRAIQAVVEAAQAGQVEDPKALSEIGLGQAEAIKDKLTSLKLTKDNSDANAVQLTQVLNEALTQAKSDPAVAPKPAENVTPAKSDPEANAKPAVGAPPAKSNQKASVKPAETTPPTALTDQGRPLLDSKATLKLTSPSSRPRISGQHALRRKKR